MAIEKFKHRGLRELFQRGRTARIGKPYQPNAKRIMDFLDGIVEIDDCIGVKDFHPLKGKRKGEYAMSVSGNYRITFTFKNGDVTIVSLEDYH